MKRALFLLAVVSFSGPVAHAAPVSTAVDAGPHLFRRVVVDPGHGGRDTGAVNPYGAVEKDLALEMALAVRDELVQRGLEVKMTRQSDEFIPLNDRAEFANAWDADLFISIHANASSSHGLRGFEVYTLSEETDDLQLAREHAGGDVLDLILWDLRARENRRQSARVAERVSARVARYVRVEAKRLKSANFRVLKNSRSPAILVEIGYLSDVRDRTRLGWPRYRQAMAGGIVDGIFLFKNEYEATDGFTR